MRKRQDDDLGELNAAEFLLGVVRAIYPPKTPDEDRGKELDEMWDRFQAAKAEYLAKKSVQ